MLKSEQWRSVCSPEPERGLTWPLYGGRAEGRAEESGGRAEESEMHFFDLKERGYKSKRDLDIYSMRCKRCSSK